MERKKWQVRAHAFRLIHNLALTIPSSRYPQSHTSAEGRNSDGPEHQPWKDIGARVGMTEEPLPLAK